MHHHLNYESLSYLIFKIVHWEGQRKLKILVLFYTKTQVCFCNTLILEKSICFKL